MSRQFVYPPSDPSVIAGIHYLAVQQWAKWQSARVKQGVVYGREAIPQKTHPDIAREYIALPPQIRDFILALTYGRVAIFAKLGSEKLNDLLAVGRGEKPLDPDLREQIAKEFHQSWWLLRQAWGLSGHPGDKHWDDETDAERANDLSLVEGWAELLAAFHAAKDDEDLRSLMNYILE